MCSAELSMKSFITMRPGALASGSSYLGPNITVLLGLRSYVQLDKHGITIFLLLKLL